MKFHIEAGPLGWDFYSVAEDGREKLLVSKTDFLYVARIFGWTGHCPGEALRFLLTQTRPVEVNDSTWLLSDARVIY